MNTYLVSRNLADPNMTNANLVSAPTAEDAAEMFALLFVAECPAVFVVAVSDIREKLVGRVTVDLRPHAEWGADAVAIGSRFPIEVEADDRPANAPAIHVGTHAVAV